VASSGATVEMGEGEFGGLRVKNMSKARHLVAALAAAQPFATTQPFAASPPSAATLPLQVNRPLAAT
jgi:hypothetical protein